MDLIDIKTENSFQEQNSRSECTSPIDGTANSNVYNRMYDYRAKIMNGQIKLKEKRGRSRVWNIFAALVDENGEDIENFVACRNCFNVYKFSNCTSNLVKHKCYAKENGSSNDQHVEVDVDTKGKLTDAATQWLVTNCRPSSILEDAGLKNMARIFLSVGAIFGENVSIESIMPIQSNVEGNISDLYESKRLEVTEELSKIKCNGYSITTYLWKDNFMQRPYVAITIHYIKQMSMVSRLLAVSSVESGFISAGRIEETVEKCLQNFDCDIDIDDPIIVTDDDENLKNAFENRQHLQCISSLLSNAIEKVFQDVSELQTLLEKCIDLAQDYRESNENFGLQTHLCPLHRSQILHYLKTVKDNRHEFSHNLLESIVNILISFEQTSQALEECNTPNIHITIPHLHKLKKLCVIDADDHGTVKALKSAIKSHLDLITSKHITKYHKIALFLFPPTKKLLVFDDSERNETLSDCKIMMQQFYVETDNSRKKIKVDIEYCADGIFSDFIEQSTSDNKIDIINQEINEYLSRKIILSEEFNVLEWWKANKILFPLLYQVSCKILGTPASVAPSQRAILKARALLCSNPMKIICDETFNEIVFLNNNFKYGC